VWNRRFAKKLSFNFVQVVGQDPVFVLETMARVTK
jgi:hypothetical protein